MDCLSPEESLSDPATRTNNGTPSLTTTTKSKDFTQVLHMFRDKLIVELQQNWSQIFEAAYKEAHLKGSTQKRGNSSKQDMKATIRSEPREYKLVINKNKDTVYLKHDVCNRKLYTFQEWYDHFLGICVNEPIIEMLEPGKPFLEITRGNFSQTLFWRTGNQCTAIAATCIVYAHTFGLPSLSTKRKIDEILYLGEQYYTFCRENSDEPANPNLTAKNIEGAFVCAAPEIRVRIEVPEDDSLVLELHGLVNNAVRTMTTVASPSSSSSRSSSGPNCLELSLETFASSSYKFAIVTANEKSVSIMKDDRGCLYLFDSHSTDDEGISAEGGMASLRKYPPNSFKALSDDIHLNIAPADDEAVPTGGTEAEMKKFYYSVNPITVSDINIP